MSAWMRLAAAGCVALFAGPAAAQYQVRGVQHYPAYQQVQVVPQFLFSYAPGASALALTQDQIDLIAQRTADLVIKRIKEEIQNEQPAPPPPVAPPPPAQVDPNIPPAKKDPVADIPAPPRTAERVLALNCASCHTGPNAKSGFKLFEADGKLAQGTDWFAVYKRASHRDPKKIMPPKPKEPLPDADLALFEAKVRGK